MAPPFDYFVVLAEMRTGSNFLESNLNSFPEITCYGEAFNPHFIGFPDRSDLLGLSMDRRDQEPLRVIDAIIAGTKGIGGFRFFHDHNARAIAHCLADVRCAKIILTRNPADSYVSWKIARETGQWKLTNQQKRRDARIRFEAGEFEQIQGRHRQFRMMVQSELQRSGQTAFHLGYDDLQDLDVLNGLARYLGTQHVLTGLSTKIKKQNPAPLREKVLNFAEMEAALAGSDYFGLAEIPDYEPRRGPNAPSYIVAAGLPLLYLPVRGRADPMVKSWMAAACGPGEHGLETGFTQKTLRQWKRQHRGHRSFTVVSHPVARAHTAFCRYILNTGDRGYGEIRENLRRNHHLPLPADRPGPDWDIGQHRTTFLAFLAFLKINLSGQTGLRVDTSWAGQSAILQGISQFVFPDVIPKAIINDLLLPIPASRLM